MYKHLQLILLILLCGFPLFAQNAEVTAPHQILAVSDEIVYVKAEAFFYWSEREQKWQQMASLADYTVHSLKIPSSSCATDESNNLWILLPLQLLHYQKKQDRWLHLQLPAEIETIPHSIFFLSGVEVWNKSLWIATPGKLWQYSFTDQQWHSHLYPERYNGGTLRRGPDRKLWLNGVAYFDGTRWDVLDGLPQSPWSNFQPSFTWDEQGNPWVTTAYGPYRYDLSQKIWQPIPQQTASDRITAMTTFRDEVWVADYGVGIYRYANGEWQEVKSQAPRPSLEYCQKFFATSSQLWINTYFGVGSFDGKKWRSHYDYTQYYPLQNLFTMTLGSVICLLFLVAVFFLIRKKKSQHLH